MPSHRSTGSARRAVGIRPTGLPFIRRLGERSPPIPASLSVTLKIEVARGPPPDGVERDRPVGGHRRSPRDALPVQRPAMDGCGVHDLARYMRQMRMVARSALMHKHTVGPLPAGLGNRDCHTAQRLLITARLPADLRGCQFDSGQD
jgi:hypothetical protein